MPKAIERKLKEIAASKGYGKKRTDAFVYGTLRHKFDWKPKRERKGRKKS